MKRPLRFPLFPSLSLAAALTAATLAPPALAQRPTGVQPVPYAPSQPVPYAAPPVAQAPLAPVPAVQGGDVVVLKGGGMIRGVLLEAIPNDHATVQLATGQTAYVPWDRVERIERASAAPAPRPQSTGGEAWVHIESDHPVILERQTRSERDGWTQVCASPCDASLPVGADYRVGGRGVRTSAPFRLAANPGEHIELDVSTASKAGFIGGIVLVSTGPILGLIGLVVAVAASETTQYDTALYAGTPTAQQQATQDGLGAAKVVGIVLGVGGVVMTVGGILMLTGNSRTHVISEPMRARPPSDDAWLRLPTWREDRAASGLPRAYDVPLFHTAF